MSLPPGLVGGIEGKDPAPAAKVGRLAQKRADDRVAQLGPLDQQAVRGAGDDRQLLKRHDLFGTGVEVMDLQVLGCGAADTVTVDERALVAVAVECLFAELGSARFAAGADGALSAWCDVTPTARFGRRVPAH
jgi:hypothetical protein